jgi:RNA polymerase sigma factor (sigma-70 family)
MRAPEERTSEDKRVVETFLKDRTEESFLPLFAAFCVRIRRFFVLHGLDTHVAEDLSQEVFVKVYRKANELRDADRFFPWMYAIARNVLISHWRQQKTRIVETELEPLAREETGVFVSETEGIPKLRLMEWLERLETEERDLVLLRFVDGLSYKELAVALNAPVGTIKWRISEVRRKLAFIIDPSGSLNRQQRASRKLS